MKCKYCNEEIADGALKCKHCQSMQVHDSSNKKNKIIAALLAIFVGGLGIHKFYLGKTFQGIIYIVFCWTFIPTIIGFIEGIIYLASSDESFNAKYNTK